MKSEMKTRFDADLLPRGKRIARLWSKTQPQHVRSLGCAAAGASHTAAARFISDFTIPKSRIQTYG